MTEIKSTLSAFTVYAGWAFCKLVIAILVFAIAEFAGSAAIAQGFNDVVVWQNSFTAAAVAPAGNADATSCAFSSSSSSSSSCASCASADANYMNGVDTVDSVNSDNWSHVVGSLSLIAAGLQILALVWGGPTMIVGFMHMNCGRQDGLKKMLCGIGALAIGSVAPMCINWLFAIVQ